MEKWTHGYVEDWSDWVVWGPEDKHGDPETSFQPAVCTLSSSYGEREARLIAAAPDLLEALIELAAIVRGECPSLLDEDSGGNSALSIEIDAAIARATGADQ